MNRRQLLKLGAIASGTFALGGVTPPPPADTDSPAPSSLAGDARGEGAQRTLAASRRETSHDQVQPADLAPLPGDGEGSRLDAGERLTGRGWSGGRELRRLLYQLRRRPSWRSTRTVGCRPRSEMSSARPATGSTSAAERREDSLPSPSMRRPHPVMDQLENQRNPLRRSVSRRGHLGVIWERIQKRDPLGPGQVPRPSEGRLDRWTVTRASGLEIRGRLTDWQGLLHRQVPEARQFLHIRW
jgi:hypothetical protein